MKNRPKTLPLSYREKKRYIVFETLSEEKAELEELIKSVWSQIINFIGTLGVGRTNLKFISDLYDERRQRFVVRCLPKDVEFVRLALALVSEINGKKAVFRSLGVTGTLKSAKIKYFSS